MAITSVGALAGAAVGKLLQALEPDGQWSITSLEPKLQAAIYGRFPVRDGISVDVAASYSVSQGLGDQGELAQFLAERSDRLSLTIELHDTTPVLPELSITIDPTAMEIGAEIKRDNVAQELALIEALCRKDPILHRPPRCRFQWGTEYARDVFILSASQQLKRIDRTSGRLAEVYVTLTMIAAVDMYLEETDPGAPEKESVEVEVRSGDTYELIAARELDDPALGQQLRQRDTENFAGILPSGARVLVLCREHSDMRAPDFRSALFVDDGSGQYESTYRQHVAERAVAREAPG